MAKLKAKRKQPKKRRTTRKPQVFIQAAKDASAEVHAAPDIAQGRYSNVAVINHSKREFTLDFIYVVGNQGTLVARIATSPAHAKQLNEVLGQNLKLYEMSHGKIDTG